MKRSIAIILTLLLGLNISAAITTNASLNMAPASVAIAPGEDRAVPEKYHKLYDALKYGLDSTNAKLDSMKTVNQVPITFAADLQTANGNIGEGLLRPQVLKSTTLFLFCKIQY